MRQRLLGSLWLGFAAAIVLPAAVLLLRLAAPAHLQEQPALVLFMIPIVLSATIAGLWPGILASIVCVLLAEYFLLPPLETLLSFTTQSLDLSLFLLGAGILSSALIETLRRQRERLRRALQAARARAEDRRASDERFSVVFHSAPVAIMIVRLSDAHLVDVNIAFTELWGYTRRQALGRTSNELSLWIEPAQLISKLRENRHSDAQELEIRTESGEVRDVLASVTLVQFDGSAHLLVTAADVTERHRAREMEHIAHHDTLTNLPNRLLLQAKLREALRRTTASCGISAVLFVDLDRFKQVNDTLGHDAGDELLRLAAARLRGRVREADTVARLGGDEFVVLLEGLSHPAEAESIGAELVRQMSMPFMLSRGREVRIGASVGISYFTADANDTELLVRQADAALYAAKNAGRNNVRVFRSEGAMYGTA